MRTKLLGLVLMAVLIFVGCASGHPVVGKYPPTIASDNPATIMLQRGNAYVGGGGTFKFTIDGEVVYHIANNQQIEFKIDHGEHYFGVMGIDALFRKTHHEIPVQCEPGKTHGLLIQIHNFIPPTIETARTLHLRQASTPQ